MPTFTTDAPGYISPLTDAFQWGTPNVFWIYGTGLQGWTVTNVAGKILRRVTDPETGEVRSNQVDVFWSDWETLDSSSDTQMKVQATPQKPLLEDGGEGCGEGGEDEFDVDSGIVTPTIALGVTFSDAITASYSD